MIAPSSLVTLVPVSGGLPVNLASTNFNNLQALPVKVLNLETCGGTGTCDGNIVSGSQINGVIGNCNETD